MLTALATIEVVPNPIYLDEKLAPDLEPADRALLARHMAVPKALIWVRFFDWLMPLMPKLPHQLIPELIPVFATWQTAFSGNKIRHCRQIGELAYRWLTEVEQAHHPRARIDRIEPFGGALNRRDVEKSLRRCGTERATGGELGGHLREARAQLRRGMNHELHTFCAWKGRADECVRRLKQVIGFEAASCNSEVVHS